VNLGYAIDKSIAMATGWPERRSMGAAWRWKRGEVVVREAVPGEYDACRAVIATAWGEGHPRGALSLRVFEDWTELDAATVLICEIAGKLTDVRLARAGRWKVARVAGITPHRDDEAFGRFLQGAAVWLFEAGYTEAVSYTDTAFVNRPEVASARRRQGQRIVAERDDGLTEQHTDLAAALARPDEAWVQ
jgi:hypothetical protein